MSFGELLRRYREEVGMSQNALGRAAGLDPSHVNRLERGKQGPPRRTTIVRLVHGLGWSLTDERAQELLAAAELPSEQTPEVNVIGHGLEMSLLPAIIQLKRTLLRAVDELSTLEEMVRRLGTPPE